MNNNVLQSLLMNQRRIAGAFSEMSGNPGVPEMVRDVFARASNELGGGIDLVESMVAIDASRGLGSNSHQLALAAQWLGMGDKVNVANLPVLLEFYDREHKFEDDRGDVLKFELWSLFLKKFPVELFKATGKIEPLSIGVTIGNVEMCIRVYISDSAVDSTEVYISSIQFDYTTVEKYWTVTGAIDRNSALFHRFKSSCNLTVHHHLEEMVYSMTMSSFGHLLDMVIMRRVCELLDVNRADLKFQSMKVEEIERMNLPLVVLTAMMGQHMAINADVTHQCYDWFMSRARFGIDVEIPEINGRAKIKCGRDNWHSYADYEKASDDYWVKSSGSTWLEVQDVRIAGIAVRAEHRFPPEIIVALRDGVTKKISELLDKLIVEWNDKPYGAYKQYLETKDDPQADNGTEPAS